MKVVFAILICMFANIGFVQAQLEKPQYFKFTVNHFTVEDDEASSVIDRDQKISLSFKNLDLPETLKSVYFECLDIEDNWCSDFIIPISKFVYIKTTKSEIKYAFETSDEDFSTLLLIVNNASKEITIILQGSKCKEIYKKESNLVKL